jgi:hypothetical protein
MQRHDGVVDLMSQPTSNHLHLLEAVGIAFEALQFLRLGAVFDQQHNGSGQGLGSQQGLYRRNSNLIDGLGRIGRVKLERRERAAGLENLVNLAAESGRQIIELQLGRASSCKIVPRGFVRMEYCQVTVDDHASTA